MELKKRICLKLQLLLILLIVSGCTIIRPIILHPIEKSDIFSIEKDTQIGDVKTEKDGYFLSEYYLNEVVKAKIEK